MNTRDELFEVMARAANHEAWFWCKEYDTFELAKKANYGRSEYSLAQSNRRRAIEKQRRAIEAIEAKGARVAPVAVSEEMLELADDDGAGSIRYFVHYYSCLLAASPFAPEKK